MKKIYALLSALMLAGTLLAQSPEGFNYQAIVRDATGNIIANTQVGMRISILQGSTAGSVVCIEEFTPTTNAFGLVTLAIGSVNTDNFSAIVWSAGPYFVKVEILVPGNIAFSEMGISQILSVPYALYAKTAENGFSGSYDDLIDKPNLFSGNYNDLTNKPILFDGTWSSLTGRPTTIVGYGITDAMSTSHASNGITATNITNWNTAFGWGNHAGLYRPITYVPVWSEITSKPTTISGYGITDAVIITGNQTIAGNKTFTGTTTVPTPVNETDAATKAYVDNVLKNLGIIPNNYAGTMTDIEGNRYIIVKIGNQTWTAQNLKTTKYNDGTAISYPGIDNTAWQNNTTGAYAWYNNDETNKATYGALYNWYAVNTSKLCPIGWHVPSDDEWHQLALFIDPSAVLEQTESLNAGGKLKETGTAHWSSPNTGATNETGFTALPGGARFSGGTYATQFYQFGSYWARTESSTTNAWFRNTWNTAIWWYRNNNPKNSGEYVRCLKD
jgi:uncharacterized protein (TIGR02145 family)